ncbi:IucA/IucC family protein [Staphylococcus hsinchuensis]|uniref:IucA/IucC family protein n=1 Tax=Staphylococcus hsinchuensis TaxID=3051183 RepID=A0ABZ3EDT1_9STAP
MNQQMWLVADQNVQHRIINAMIKEHIYTEDTQLSESDELVIFNKNNYKLNIEKVRTTALMRYQFNGFPQFVVGERVEEVASVERLLEIIEHYFDIPVSQRLTEELVSSRNGFVLTYKHFENRKALIKSSLQFTKMPESLNFFAWLQYLNDNNQLDELNYSESLILEGHPTHPLSKTKLPLTDEEVKRYAPEFEKIIPLKIMLIHHTHCVTTSMEQNDQYILDYIIPEYKGKLEAFLAPYQLKLEDYRVMIVHPWQYDNVIVQQFSEWIKESKLLPTPFEIESKATLSFRTMALLHKPYHIKLPVNVQATSAVRTVSTVTTVDGPKLSYELQDMLNIYPQLQVSMEPYGIHAMTDLNTARQLGVIVRQQPKIDHDGITLVTASLVNRNPVDGKVIVDSYLDWVGEGVTTKAIKRFIKAYAETLIKPLLAYIQDFGIALEAHMQNTIVSLGEGFQMKFNVRDLGGSRIDLKTFNHRVPHVELTNKSLIAEDIVAVIAKFQHAVIQNQIAELIHHFTQYEGVAERELFDIVREVTQDSIDNNKPHATQINNVLFGRKITVKSLLRMRMESKVKQYVTIDLDNPLYREV